MNIFSFLRYGLGVTAAAGILAGCSSGVSQGALSPGVQQAAAAQPQHSKIISLIPEAFQHKGPMPLHGRKAPKQGRKGIYVSSYGDADVYGYRRSNLGDKPSVCSESVSTHVNDIAVDGAGNLMVPNAFSGVNVYQRSPGMCGALAGTISDSYGQAIDAASANALTGTVAVANVQDTGGTPGSISVCTLSAGCTANLTNADMAQVAGVAMDNSGNCWASAFGAYGGDFLIYFAGCAGAGVAATGYVNGSAGGLDIDNDGNLVTLGSFSSEMWVYSGCNPACTLVGGPFTLHGDTSFGHLNKGGSSGANARFAAGDWQYGQVDVYSYTPTSLTYLFSFNNGLPGFPSTEGVAYAPRSKQ